DFVANVSHELKTPLTSIRMFIEMLTLGRSSSPEEVQESLQIILRESERLGRLIDRLLDFNRLDRKTKVFNMTSMSLSEVLRETVKLYRVEEPSSQERRIKLAIEPGLPYIEGDRDALREVILNLLANADKYSPTEKPIDVRLSREGRYLLLDVVDHGQGIPLKYHTRIFEKFYRVNDELSRQVEGTGLGLSISQQIAKAHDGVIEVDSAPGQGSCFTLRLPIASAIQEDEAREEED
ncbi:MAG: two-component sensor histidine kinase, partial [Planctomycetes bacterium]|nr:two-component sensor histidine kinase [Planctomycetota bacterium]